MVDIVKQEKEKHTWISLIIIAAQAFSVGTGVGYGAHIALQKWVFHEQICEEGKCIETSKIEANYVNRSAYDATTQQLAMSETAAKSANQLVASKDALIESLKRQLDATSASADVKRTVCANLLSQIKSLDDERLALQDRGTTSSLIVFDAHAEDRKGSELNKRRLEQIQERLTKLGDDYASCAANR